MKIPKILIISVVFVAGIMQATSVTLNNNSSFVVVARVIPWSGFIGGKAAWDRDSSGNPWGEDIFASPTTGGIHPGKSGRAYVTQGIVGIELWATPKDVWETALFYKLPGESGLVRIFGNDGKDYTDNLNIPKGANWELEIKDGAFDSFELSKRWGDKIMQKKLHG